MSPYVEDGIPEEPVKPLTVSSAIKLHGGNIKVQGIISSFSQQFKMIRSIIIECVNCGAYNGNAIFFNPPVLTIPKITQKIKCINCSEYVHKANPEWINVIKVTLRNKDTSANMDELTCILYEKDTGDMQAGGLVTVTGDLYVITSGKKICLPHLFSSEIEYEYKDEIIVTPKDMIACEEFVKYPNLINRLVSMFAPNVKDNNIGKLAILRSVVQAPVRNNGYGSKQTLDTIFIGPPGLAKSTIASEGLRLIQNSKYVGAQNASGKSITAIIDKDNDGTYHLMMGPIIMAKNSVCMIDEIGAMLFEEQKHLQRVMEEGKVVVDKYGQHFELDSPTTIIATCNPKATDWKNGLPTINNDEFPIMDSLLDRFDQKIVFVDMGTNENQIRDYAEFKTEQEKKKPHNYNYLRKYLKYASSISPVFSLEASELLNEFWIGLKLTGEDSNRSWNRIRRIAEAHARLHLKEVVDVEIAKEVMKHYGIMVAEYGKVIQVVENPRDIAIREILSIVENCKGTSRRTWTDNIQ